MTDSLRITGNRPYWTPGRSGFYEVYYVIWKDLARRHIGWVRHIVRAPTEGEAQASVWGAYLDMDDASRNVAIQQGYSVDQVSTSAAPFRHRIGAHEMGQGTAVGAVEGGGGRVAWDVRFETEGALVNHIPVHWGPFPRTKFISPYCGGRLSGTLRVGDEVIEVKQAAAVQSHFWGTKIVAAWVWGHCSTFREDPDFVFDGVWAQERIAGLTLKPITCLCFHWQGRTYSCNSLVQSLFTNRSAHGMHHWTFEAKSGDLLFRGSMSALPGRKIIWTHRDPDGEPRYGHLDFTADLRVEILQRQGSEWRLVKTLTAERSATFEVSQTEPRPETGTAYPLVDVPPAA
jgi:hypothetical protein